MLIEEAPNKVALQPILEPYIGIFLSDNNKIYIIDNNLHMNYYNINVSLLY